MNDEPAETHGQNPQPISLWRFIGQNPVTVSLLAACLMVAGWTALGSSLPAVRWLTFVDLVADEGRLLPGLGDGQVWRLLTPIFLHFGIIHLVFNMMWLYDLGGIIEAKWRSLHLLALVVIIGVLANAAQFAINWDFLNGVRFANALSGGLSGVVYGLFGYIWMRGKLDPSLGIRLHQQTVVLMLGWLVFCMTGMMGHIGNMAHAAGLLLGVVSALIVAGAGRKTASRDDER